MSGRKQHFVPQSLLKGFGVKKGKKTYVVAYTFDRGVFSPPTEGIGAERSFYSELEVERTTQTLDDKITDYEQRIPGVLEQLREASTHSNPAVPAQFVTHLTVRNDHFRKAASMGGANLFEGMRDVLSNEDTAKVLMGIAGDKPGEAFATELPKMWEELRPFVSMLGMTEEQFNEWAFQAVKANFSSFHAEVAGPLEKTLGSIIRKAPEAAAIAQRRSLSENLSPPKRVERLAEFRWHTVEWAEPLVLPDCVAIGVDGRHGILPLMLANLDQTDTIFMPLATNRLLIGSHSEEPAIPEDLNKAFARCSWDFFVGRDRTPKLEGYRTLLRTTSEEFLSGTVREVIEESLAKNRPE